MDYIDMSLAPHRFDKCTVEIKDEKGYPSRVNYYWKGSLVFHILMTFDENGWRTNLEIFNDKPPITR